MVSTFDMANIAYCAEGPIGHGRALFLHIAHVWQLVDQVMKWKCRVSTAACEPGRYDYDCSA